MGWLGGCLCTMDCQVQCMLHKIQSLLNKCICIFRMANWHTISCKDIITSWAPAFKPPALLLAIEGVIYSIVSVTVLTQTYNQHYIMARKLQPQSTKNFSRYVYGKSPNLVTQTWGERSNDRELLLCSPPWDQTWTWIYMPCYICSFPA